MHNADDGNPYRSPGCHSISEDERTPTDPGSHARNLAQLGAWVLLTAGIPPYVLCGVLHICMDGHMRHPPYAYWHRVIDVTWIAGIVVGVVLCCIHSDRSRKKVILGGAILFISRVLLASAGGGLFLLELPLIGIVVYGAIANLHTTSPDQQLPIADSPQAHDGSAPGGVNRDAMID